MHPENCGATCKYASCLNNGLNCTIEEIPYLSLSRSFRRRFILLASPSLSSQLIYPILYPNRMLFSEASMRV